MLFQPRIECWYYDKVFLGKSFPGAAALRNRASSIEESSTTCTTYVYKKIEARGKLIQVPYRSLDTIEKIVFPLDRPSLVACPTIYCDLSSYDEILPFQRMAGSFTR